MLPEYAEPNVDRVSSLRPACVIRPDLHLIEHGPLAPLTTGWTSLQPKVEVLSLFQRLPYGNQGPADKGCISV
jgi:hypothetical protein